MKTTAAQAATMKNRATQAGRRRVLNGPNEHRFLLKDGYSFFTLLTGIMLSEKLERDARGAPAATCRNTSLDARCVSFVFFQRKWI